jgi:cell division protein FtsB
MEMVRERTIAQERVVSKEEQEHNARISERYLQLKNAVEDQFAQKTPEMTVESSVYTSDVAVQTPSFAYTPAVEQRPQVTEYIRNLRQSIFTSETFTGVSTENQQETAQITQNPAKAVVAEGYCLTTFAKAVMAAFALVVIALMAWIGANTQMLEQKSVRLNSLQAQRQELVQRNQELTSRIEEAKSEESIRQYAESRGMVKAD